MHLPAPHARFFALAVLVLFAPFAGLAHAQDAAPAPEALRATIDRAVEAIRPALVRIHVVETYYSEGRELKYETSGSGVVITEAGHIVTNHHVAGHAKSLKVTFWDKEELAARLVGTDPLTDIAVIQIEGAADRTFTTAKFGDSSTVRVGDSVLAMGSPLALSQSVTLGIMSNTEMIMPAWMQRGGGLELDGEDVGSLVRWFGHDAAIFGGNSGGPLVNLQGEIIGINEIDLGLGGAIPGNLAREVADQLMAHGKIVRAWLGLDVQPRLKHGAGDTGVLISGTVVGSPAERAGLQAGDRLVSLQGAPVDVRFAEQLPEFNRLVASLPIGQEVTAEVKRGEETLTLKLTAEEREPQQPKEYELKQWGLTVRDISSLMARELKRDSSEGVLVTSVRPGGPAGDAKPAVQPKDILLRVGDTPVRNVAELQAATEAITKDATEPVATLTTFERKAAEFLTVVKVGVKELQDPGLEVKKAWLPVKTQVITRDIAELLGDPALTGFRITHVFAGSTAEKAGLKVGDLILAVDDEVMTASAPEHYEDLPALIRQYSVGTAANLKIRRGTETSVVPVELVRAPKLDREMKKYRDEDFEFTVRDITFFDRAEEQWEEVEEGVLVEQVVSGGWAALGLLSTGDLILEVSGVATPNVETVMNTMHKLAEEKPKSVVFKVLRGIHTLFIELEPKWDNR
jgi:serine protease Do